jgi:4a-hydroxytetrahydrobiopterin dehydratase
VKRSRRIRLNLLQAVLRDPSTPLCFARDDDQKTPARFAVAKRISGVTRCPVMADLMKADELKTRLKKIPEWELEKKHIERTFEFDDFADAIDFVNAVAEVAEEEEHHPDIDIRYNKVHLVLSTHSKGGLTELDFGLAERIDTLSE